MTEIPDDVMEAAKYHAKAHYDTNPKSPQWEFDVLMVARAILAERERCAMVFEEYLTKQTDRRIESMSKKGIK